jgi:hypothetical protein
VIVWVLMFIGVVALIYLLTELAFWIKVRAFP